MDVLTNNRIQVANCNISALTTCVGGKSTCSAVSSVLSCVQGAYSNISPLQSCVGGKATCGSVSSVLSCVQGAYSNIGGIQSCLSGKSSGCLGMEVLGQTNNNYTGCLCTGIRTGKYAHYRIVGTHCCWTYYCSSMALGFAGACGGGCTANNYGSWCCNQCGCGVIWQAHCSYMGSYNYGCAGHIENSFGCTGGCFTACSTCGYAFEVDIWPHDICNACIGFRYMVRTQAGQGGYMCCYGLVNSGHAFNCCGADPTCLQYVCFTNPSAVCNMGCGQFTIFGQNRLA